MARYKRRGRRAPSISKRFKVYLLAFLQLGLAGFITGIVGYISTFVNGTTLTIGSLEVSASLFMNIIGFATGIVLVLSALRKLGIHL